MSLIEWKEHFSLGVPDVDYEHRQLIELINELHDAIESGGTHDEVIAGLGEIYAHISAHFALEEKIMRDMRYPAYVEHKNDHEALLDDLRDIMDRVEDDGRYDQARLGRDLEHWFTEHFRTHDAKLHKQQAH
jgi:hemerythrin